MPMSDEYLYQWMKLDDAIYVLEEKLADLRKKRLPFQRMKRGKALKRGGNSGKYDVEVCDQEIARLIALEQKISDQLTEARKAQQVFEAAHRINV